MACRRSENDDRPHRERQHFPEAVAGNQPEYQDSQRRDLSAKRATNDAATTKRNRRFAAAKAARLSEAAGIARAAAQQLTAAKTRVLDEVAKAEAAGFIVQEDLSVIQSMPGSSRSTVEAQYHAATIQAARD